MEKYSKYGKLTALDGHGKTLLSLLLEASEELKAVASCDCYIVGMNEEEPNAVYVFEVWENKAAHEASLTLDVVRNLIGQAMPILDLSVHSHYPELIIYGGKATL
ncbi:antibiotic biosynthesis monooxygenase [uncultured Vagococcus sp.]|uniref:putative quinol monooxygenase n=1 Tax=uncultured Vagococcus sp. TaxID=189676 RepID=UPI0028D198F9|nr:antibiotic biosynthesis monooxygenase [uncultured Vagococcus sp.]